MVKKSNPGGKGKSKSDKAQGVNTKALEKNNKELQSLSKRLEASLNSAEKTIKKLESSISKGQGPKPSDTSKPTPVAHTAQGGMTLGVLGNVASTLMSHAKGLYEFQDKFVKLLTSTGNQNMGTVTQIGKTFEARGISLEANLDILTSVLEGGIGEYSRTLGDFTTSLSSAQSKELQIQTLAEYRNLGKDTKSLAALMGANSQVLGISHAQTGQLASNLVGLGAAYGFNSDKLVKALNSLSDTFMKSASVFGAQTAGAGQEAIASMIAKFGPEQAKNIQSLARTLQSGTKEAAITAMKLGVKLEDINSSNAATQEAAMMQALQSLNAQTQTGGSAGAGLWVNDLVKALGGTDEMLNLSRHSNQLSTKQIETNLATAAEEARMGSMKANVDQALHDVIKGLIPLMDRLMPPLVLIAELIGKLGNTVQIILMQMIARKVVGGMQKMGGRFTKGMQAKPGQTIAGMNSKGMKFSDAKSGKSVNAQTGKAGLLGGTTKATQMNPAQKATISMAKNQMKTGKSIAKFGARFMTGGLMRGVGLLLGPWGLLLGLIPDILSMFGISLSKDEEAERDRKKTIEILSKPSKQEVQLQSIARMLNQSNIYLEGNNLLAEEQVEATRENYIPPGAFEQRPSEQINIQRPTG